MITDPAEIPGLVSRMWNLNRKNAAKFDNIRGFIRGERGLPQVPDGASDEIKQIRRLSVHNVLTLVVDAFVQNLSVTGYRDADAQVNAAAWALWQANQMDARQAEIYSSVVKYGVGFAVAEKGPRGPVLRLRSPRDLIATYADPSFDRWPQYALDTWVDTSGARSRRRGYLIDEVHFWPLDLGPISDVSQGDDAQGRKAAWSVSEGGIGEPIPHGAVLDGEQVCPVVRYLNRRDTDDLIDGEIERLIPDQRKINEINFDRMIVARFGAFPQTVLSNWESMPADKQAVLKASMSTVWSFTEDVKASRLPAASLTPYNELIEAIEVHVAMRAQISPAYITGRMVNLSAEALAAAEANMHRKLAAMRESHGESHEQLLRLTAAMNGDPVQPESESAEVIWRDTEARSFGAIVDGITKLGAAIASGAPIEPFLPLVPGLSQQMISSISVLAESLRAQQQTQSMADLVAGIRGSAAQVRSNAIAAAAAERTAPADGGDVSVG